MLVIAGTITIDPARRGEMEAAFDEVRAASLEEPGCLAYQAYADRSDPAVLFLFERWESPEALRRHFETSHMQRFMAAMGGLGVRGMEVRRYEVSSEGPLL